MYLRCIVLVCAVCMIIQEAVLLASACAFMCLPSVRVCVRMALLLVCLICFVRVTAPHAHEQRTDW